MCTILAVHYALMLFVSLKPTFVDFDSVLRMLYARLAGSFDFLHRHFVNRSLQKKLRAFVRSKYLHTQQKKRVLHDSR